MDYGEKILHALKVKADLERNRQKASMLETVVQKLKGGEADTKIFLSQCEEENIKRMKL